MHNLNSHLIGDLLEYELPLIDIPGRVPHFLLDAIPGQPEILYGGDVIKHLFGHPLQMNILLARKPPNPLLHPLLNLIDGLAV